MKIPNVLLTLICASILCTAPVNADSWFTTFKKDIGCLLSRKQKCTDEQKKRLRNQGLTFAAVATSFILALKYGCFPSQFRFNAANKRTLRILKDKNLNCFFYEGPDMRPEAIKSCLNDYDVVLNVCTVTKHNQHPGTPCTKLYMKKSEMKTKSKLDKFEIVEMSGGYAGYGPLFDYGPKTDVEVEYEKHDIYAHHFKSGIESTPAAKEIEIKENMVVRFLETVMFLR